MAEQGQQQSQQTGTPGQPGPQQTGSPQTGGEGTPPESTPVKFDEWVKAQPQNIQDAFTSHTSGLRTALSSERQSREQLERQVRDLVKKTEKGSDMESQLTQLADSLASTQQKLDFYEQASGRGIPYLDVAYQTAVVAGGIDGKGRVNWPLLEEKYPLIFKAPEPKAPAGRIGTGTQTQAPQPGGMNSWIRRTSGRK